MKLLRVLAILITQVPLILFLGARFDLVFGFNRTESGFAVLLFLFVFVPLLNLSWVVAEIVRSFRYWRRQSSAATFLWPVVSIAILLESIAVDLYIASFARM